MDTKGDPHSHDKLLNTNQACEYLGISYTQMYHLIRNSDLPAHKIGKVWRIHFGELEAWVRKQPKSISEYKQTTTPVSSMREDATIVSRHKWTDRLQEPIRRRL